MSQFPALIARAVQAFGGLDVLINNASTFYPTPVGDITEIDWDDLLGTNLKAPLFLAQAANAPLRERAGLILNVADIHGLRPLRRYPVYSIAKAGLIMLTKSLAREMGPHVRVNAVAPGPVMWPADGLDKELQEKIIRRTALKAPRICARSGARLPVLCERCALRHRPGAGGGWRAQHRLVTRRLSAAASPGDARPDRSAATAPRSSPSRSGAPHPVPGLRGARACRRASADRGAVL